MSMDADLYRASLVTVHQMLEGKNYKEAIANIGLISAVTRVHIAIVCCYIGEIIGFKQDLYDYLDVLLTFYRLKGIDNVFVDGVKVGLRGIIIGNEPGC